MYAIRSYYGDADVVVVSGAVADDNPELQVAHAARKPVIQSYNFV